MGTFFSFFDEYIEHELGATSNFWQEMMNDAKKSIINEIKSKKRKHLYNQFIK